MAIQRAGKESSIPSLEIDWNKIAQEAKAIDEKYNGAIGSDGLPVKDNTPIRLAKQTSGNMYTQKSQLLTGLFDAPNVPEPEIKQAEEVRMSLPKHLNGTFDPEDRTMGNGVRSANGSTVSDIGGPAKFMKSESSPSIWDTDKLQRAVEEMNVKTTSDKQQMREARKTIRQQSNDNLMAMLETTDLRKASNVAPAGDQSVDSDQARFGKVTRNISIFDCMDGKTEFNSLPTLTSGEKVTQEKKAKAAEVDDSWRKDSRPTTSQGMLDKLYDTLTKTEDQK